MMETARLARKIAQAPPFADLVEEELSPGPSMQADDDVLAFMRATGQTVYHPCGSNRMGSDDRAVLDPQLCVRGVEGLRVVDASAFPLMPSSNMQPAVLMLAERAAERLRSG